MSVTQKLKSLNQNLNQTYKQTSDLAWLYSSDNCGVDEGFGPLGRVLNEALPLAWKPHKLLLLLIKISVDTMLKVGGCRDLDTLLFFLAEHGCSRASDLEAGKDKNNYLCL